MTDSHVDYIAQTDGNTQQTPGERAADRMEPSDALNPDWEQVDDFFRRWYGQAPGIYELAFTRRGGGKLLTGYADHPAVALSLVRTAYNAEIWAGVYIGLNPLDAAPAGREVNSKMRGGDTRASNDLVARRHRLLIDADAVSDDRGPEEMATAVEQAEALALRDTVRNSLEALGWPDPAHITSSGNGGGLIYLVDLPVTAPSNDLVRQVLLGVQAEVGSAVDTKVHDATRLTKVSGTPVLKGPNTPERPWRLAHEDAYSAAAGVVSGASLKAVAMLVHHEPVRGGQDELLARVKSAVYAKGFAVDHEKPWEDGYLLDLDRCMLTETPHEVSNSPGYIVIGPLGVSIKCHKAGCEGLTKRGPEAAAFLGIQTPELTQRGDNDDRPMVLRGLPAEEAAALVWLALAERNNRLPQPRLLCAPDGRKIVRLRWAQDGLSAAEIDSKDVLAHEVRRSCRFYEVKQRGEVRVREHAEPPLAVLLDMLASDAIPLPRLTEVHTAPVFLADGTLLWQRGFDPASGIAMDIPADLKDLVVPEVVTRDDAVKALAYLEDLLSDFTMQTGWDGGNMIGMMLTPFMRPSINTICPLFPIEAPIQGAGKTALGLALVRPALGRQDVYITYKTGDRSELGKQLATEFAKGKWAIGIDNVTGYLNSTELSGLLTTDRLHLRLLGTNNSVIAPVAPLLFLSGNNMKLNLDTIERSARIRLVVDDERPSGRALSSFNHPEVWDTILETRAGVVGHILVLIKHWYDEGRPEPQWLMPRYAQWSRHVHGVLQAAGRGAYQPDERGYADGYTEFREEEAGVEEDGMTTLIHAWYDLHKTKEVTAGDIDEFAQNIDGVSKGKTPELSTERCRYYSQSLLPGLRGRVFDIYSDAGVMLCQVKVVKAKVGKKARGGARWRLIRGTQSQPTPQKNPEMSSKTGGNVTLATESVEPVEPVELNRSSNARDSYLSTSNNPTSNSVQPDEKGSTGSTGSTDSVPAGFESMTDGALDLRTAVGWRPRSSRDDEEVDEENDEENDEDGWR